MSAIALALGALTGFIGAIPPGPSSMAVAEHAAEGRGRRAIAVGLGAASVDVTFCGAIVLGAGPLLARITAAPAVRFFLAVAYASLGALLVAEALLSTKRRKPRPPRIDGFASGVVRGITNPALLANWTAVIAALTAANILPRGSLPGALFALGVGLGVASWFGVLAHVVERARGERFSPWLRGAGLITGAMLVLGGGLGAMKALGG